MKLPTRTILTISSALFLPSLYAHYPVMDCYAKSEKIDCKVGFSDGSKAIGKEVRLISYEEELIERQNANKFSKVSFENPNQPFYIYFDAKHEFPIEIDYEELIQVNPTP